MGLFGSLFGTGPLGSTERVASVAALSIKRRLKTCNGHIEGVLAMYIRDFNGVIMKGHSHRADRARWALDKANNHLNSGIIELPLVAILNVYVFGIQDEDVLAHEVSHTKLFHELIGEVTDQCKKHGVDVNPIQLNNFKEQQNSALIQQPQRSTKDLQKMWELDLTPEQIGMLFLIDRAGLDKNVEKQAKKELIERYTENQIYSQKTMGEELYFEFFKQATKSALALGEKYFDDDQMLEVDKHVREYSAKFTAAYQTKFIGVGNFGCSVILQLSERIGGSYREIGCQYYGVSDNSTFEEFCIINQSRPTAISIGDSSDEAIRRELEKIFVDTHILYIATDTRNPLNQRILEILYAIVGEYNFGAITVATKPHTKASDEENDLSYCCLKTVKKHSAFSIVVPFDLIHSRLPTGMSVLSGAASWQLGTDIVTALLSDVNQVFIEELINGVGNISEILEKIKNNYDVLFEGHNNDETLRDIIHRMCEQITVVPHSIDLFVCAYDEVSAPLYDILREKVPADTQIYCRPIINTEIPPGFTFITMNYRWL